MTNTSIDVIVNKLNDAAREGDINLLYTLIDEEPEVLDKLDAKPFIETPLHVAACAGKLQFATEIMRLKPSFDRRLNKQGYSPIHLALQHNQKRMVERFIDMDEDLVRAKGREGITPLHIVSQNGDIDMLANFLSACPDSINDVTVRSETALHIAVKHKQLEALQVLVGWLTKTGQGRQAKQLENDILNWKDDEGNTVLHISALLNDSQALGILINTSKMELQSKNLENLTVLDITSSSQMKDRLVRGGAKHGSSIIESAATLADKLRSDVSVMSKIFIHLSRMNEEITEEQRNSLMVVATLVAAAAYQSGVNPPGGYNSSDDHQNTTSTSFNNTTTTAAAMQGKSVLSKSDFQVLSAINWFAFILSISFIMALAPNGTRLGRTVVPLIVFMLIFSYVYSVLLISPKSSSRNDRLIVVIIYALEALAMVILLRFFKFLGLQNRIKGYVPITAIKSGKGEGRNRW